jgi:hypothetical protein
MARRSRVVGAVHRAAAHRKEVVLDKLRDIRHCSHREDHQAEAAQMEVGNDRALL